MMKIIGHRGAKGLAPENTVASFMKAIEHAVDEIEFDVRVTRDGVAIIQHDAKLHDPAGNGLSVIDTDFDELLAHKPDLTTFEAGLRRINRAVPVLIEVKPGVPTPPVIKIIKQLLAEGWTTEDMLLGSFSQPILRELQIALPQIPKVVIESWSGVRATLRARELKTDRLSMNHHWIWSGFVRAMSRGGYKLVAYTLDDPVKAKRWARHGLYGTITDYPDRFQ